MVSKNTVLISVHKDIKEKLDKLKLHPSLSYNDVVEGLIDFWKSAHKSPEPEIDISNIEDKRGEPFSNPEPEIKAKAEIDKVAQAKDFTEDNEFQQEPLTPENSVEYEQKSIVKELVSTDNSAGN